MAYEKYIKKDGKLYGPYIYHSKRVDGKVVSEYHGPKKIEYGKFLWIIPLIALIILGAYFIGKGDKGLAGYSILDLNANYENGQLGGNLKIGLQEGELIPADSIIVFENAGQRQEYFLKDVISEPTIEGDFFVEGKSINGSGAGFGIPGTKEFSPDISFILLIYSKINETENIESEREIPGSVSKNNTFTYTLQEGERAELKPRSVRTNSNQLDDNDVSVNIGGDVVSVSTDYTEEGEGFGIEYSGEKTKELLINLNDLNLQLQKGELKVSVFYQEEIFSLQTNVGEGDVSAQEIVEEEQTRTETIQTTNESTNAAIITETLDIAIPELSLTPEERTALEKEFGNISLSVKEAKEKNGFIIVRYELGSFWIEYSYSSGLDQDTRASLIEADRTKWLKDIAQSLLQPEEKEQEINISF